ncbi:ABC transporter ATP-binding protein [Clostridium tetani]|uniref:ABC transporter ATP-binding protein n=1 Tax=Clostridium tetani TaxID=1513 RepID=UPI002954E4A9|nr:ABC transporter ATP-binding protein [Clostridium tetani]
MYMLTIKNIYKTYGSGTGKVQVLNGINLTVNKGEFLSIMGPSGSGKSTLLHIMAGLDKPTKGEIIFKGKNIYDLNENILSDLRRKEFGFIFQSFNLIPVLTAEENIKLPLMVDKGKFDIEYFNYLVEYLNIKDRLHYYPSQLSGGQQQRVAIARALVTKPNIVFADEPTGNLDSNSTNEVLNILCSSIKKFNQTLIMITHDLNVASYGDRVLKLKDGSIIKN